MRCRCQHCGIFILAHPRNAGRKDLGCPFGCREAHRKQESNKRSAAYYGDEQGKKIKRDLNSKRKPSKKEASEAEPQSELRVDVNTEAELAAGIELSAETELAAEPELAAELGAETELVAEAATEPGLESEAELEADPELAAGAELADEAKPQEPGVQKPELEKPIEQSQARAQSGWSKDILEYLRQVTSLIEGRRVGLREVVQMVHEVLRQHTLARRRYIDHIIAQLHQNPP